MYYKLNSSGDPKVIGQVNSQAEHALFDLDANHPFLSRNILRKKIQDEKSVITITPILVKNAKLTDWFSGSANGNGSMQPMISEKMKSILVKENHHGIQFFSMKVVYKGKEITNYWLVNPFGFDIECLYFEKSSFKIKNLEDYTFTENISLRNEQQFNDHIKAIKLPKVLLIEKPIIKEKSKNLLLLDHVKGGIGYYVSQPLKNKIEDAGCTGIEFEPVDEA